MYRIFSIKTLNEGLPIRTIVINKICLLRIHPLEAQSITALLLEKISTETLAWKFGPKLDLKSTVHKNISNF